MDSHVGQAAPVEPPVNITRLIPNPEEEEITTEDDISILSGQGTEPRMVNPGRERVLNITNNFNGPVKNLAIYQA